MTQAVDEQLSAFLDGELPASEEELLLRRLERDTGLRERLARYASIGEVLRGGSLAPGTNGLGERVSRLVAEESFAARGDVPSRWSGLATAGLAAAAGLVVLSGLLSLGTVATNPATSVPSPALVAERSAVAPLGAARLTGYLVAHGDYAGGISRQVVSSHVVNRTPDLVLLSASGGALDE